MYWKVTVKVRVTKSASATGVEDMLFHVDMLGLRQFGKAAKPDCYTLGKSVDLHEEPK